MSDEDPEISEARELGQIERGKMGLPRAHHILIAALVLLVLAVILIAILHR